MTDKDERSHGKLEGLEASRVVARVEAFKVVKDAEAFMNDVREMMDPKKGYTRSGILKMLARHLKDGGGQ